MAYSFQAFSYAMLATQLIGKLPAGLQRFGMSRAADGNFLRNSQWIGETYCDT